MAADARWPSSQDTVRRISDVVHSSIALPPPLDVIVDTVEFQRLRNIRQLGAADLVFPCANHTRFTHCIGASHIAQLFMEALRADQSLHITGADALCVALAALCHDIGHGPYSHLYDGPFLESVGRKWTHEEGSKALLNRVLRTERVETALRPFLGPEGEEEYERNLLFIQECISPPSPMMDDSGAWLPKGRPREKAFLYDIVSNVHDGFDVDKFDYILRDAHFSGVGIRFNRESLLRLIHNIRVLPCPRVGIPRICFAKKTADDLLSLADSRHSLHARVYQHHTVKLLEAMIVKALVAAEPHFHFENAERKSFTLSTIIDDYDLFCTVDDSVLQMIGRSHDPQLAKARRIVLAIRERRLARRISLVECSPSAIKAKTGNGGPDVARMHQKICKDISERLLQAVPTVDDEQVFVLSRRLFSGLDGCRHPMSEVLVFDNKAAKPTAGRLNEHWLDLRASRHTTVITFALYVSRDLSDSQTEDLKREFESALENYGIHKTG